MPNVAAPTYYAGSFRDIVVPLVAGIAAFFSPILWIVIMYIVTGQAHFLMALRYQSKGRRIGILYVVTAVVLALVLVTYMLNLGSMAILLSVTGILFALHFAVDEFTLHSEELTKSKKISAITFTALFAGLVIHFVTHLPDFVSIGMAVMVVVGLSMRFLMAEKVSRAERYLVYVAVLLGILSMISKVPITIFGVIVLLHIFNWYVGYGGRVHGNVARARAYWVEVVLTLALMSGLYILYAHFQVAVLGVFFSIGAFYAWAIAHIVLSFIAGLPKRTS